MGLTTKALGELSGGEANVLLIIVMISQSMRLSKLRTALKGKSVLYAYFDELHLTKL